MTSVVPDSDPTRFDGLEVATTGSDTLRASITVRGELAPASAALLTSVLRTHVVAGRRYLRVDLAAARITGPGVLAGLVAAHDTIAELGGMLVFENAGPDVVDAIRAATLFVAPG